MAIRCRMNGYGQFDASRGVGPARWAWFDLLFVHTGELVLGFLDGPQNVRLVAGQGVLIYPETDFRGRAVSSIVRASAHHFESPPAGLLGVGRLRRGYRVFPPVRGPLVETYIDQVIRAASAPPGRLTNAVRSALMLVLLAELTSIKPPAPGMDRFQAIPAWLRSRLGNPPGLDEMAEHAGFSASHFRRRFRQVFKQSPGKYALEQRMREAGRLLRETREPIKRVARRVGYRHAPHFCRAFASYYSTTPSAYRSSRSIPA